MKVTVLNESRFQKTNALNGESYNGFAPYDCQVYDKPDWEDVIYHVSLYRRLDDVQIDYWRDARNKGLVTFSRGSDMGSDLISFNIKQDLYLDTLGDFVEDLLPELKKFVAAWKKNKDVLPADSTEYHESKFYREWSKKLSHEVGNF